MAQPAVEHLDDRGRATVKPAFRDKLRRGYLQVLTPEGVLFLALPERLRVKGRSLERVDDEALKDV